MIRGASFRRERMAAAASDELIAATDSPTCSCAAGCRSASRTASSPGSCASRSTSGRKLSEFTPEQLAAHSEHLDAEVHEVLAQRSWLESKISEGGTSLARVREQLGRARALLGGVGWLSGRGAVPRDAACLVLRPAGRSTSRVTSSAASCASATARA